MNEPIEFKYCNDGSLTQPQAVLVAKLASYCHISNKELRSKLNHSSLSEGVIKFDDSQINDSFYITSFKLNFNELLNTKKFKKSKFLMEYLLAKQVFMKGALFTIYSAPNIYVLIDFDEWRGVGGIYMNYPPDIFSLPIPLNTYRDQFIPVLGSEE